jgi:transcriptional regulator EpsA
MIHQTITLQGEERERFSEIVDASLRVHRMSSLFMWTQGALQALLPHDILIFGMAQGGGSRIAFHKFASTRYFRDSHFAEVCRPRDGLLEGMMALWGRTGEPCMVSPANDFQFLGDKQWIDIVEKNELRNAAAHGVRAADGRISSFFCFSRVGVELGPRLAYLLWLVTPHLHETLGRVLANEGRGAIRVLRTDCRVTQREAEILRWIRDGKTNHDIADILELSPHTVKNHVKKIMKKMGVENRSHAVARAFSLGILSPNDG